MNDTSLQKNKAVWLGTAALLSAGALLYFTLFRQAQAQTGNAPARRCDYFQLWQHDSRKGPIGFHGCQRPWHGACVGFCVGESGLKKEIIRGGGFWSTKREKGHDTSNANGWPSYTFTFIDAEPKQGGSSRAVDATPVKKASKETVPDVQQQDEKSAPLTRQVNAHEEKAVEQAGDKPAVDVAVTEAEAEAEPVPAVEQEEKQPLAPVEVPEAKEEAKIATEEEVHDEKAVVPEELEHHEEEEVATVSTTLTDSHDCNSSSTSTSSTASSAVTEHKDDEKADDAVLVDIERPVATTRAIPTKETTDETPVKADFKDSGYWQAPKSNGTTPLDMGWPDLLPSLKQQDNEDQKQPAKEQSTEKTEKIEKIDKKRHPKKRMTRQEAIDQQKQNYVPSMKSRCNWWPNCTNKNCKYFHPHEPCRFGDLCIYNERCMYLHDWDLEEPTFNKRRRQQQGSQQQPSDASASAPSHQAFPLGQQPWTIPDAALTNSTSLSNGHTNANGHANGYRGRKPYRYQSYNNNQQHQQPSATATTN
ncbi:hypothetical protein BC940DRAFT_289842 [Gongronella butleri]|nr:hypothetical protein BC940DRAFT_289842 [Gongronella butleri]